MGDETVDDIVDEVLSLLVRLILLFLGRGVVEVKGQSRFRGVVCRAGGTSFQDLEFMVNSVGFGDQIVSPI